MEAAIPAFNSATAVTPWVTFSRGNFALRNPAFNSATAVTPWVTYSWSSRHKNVRGLQFGHGGDAVGDL